MRVEHDRYSAPAYGDPVASHRRNRQPAHATMAEGAQRRAVCAKDDISDVIANARPLVIS
ncbi:MAG TPA: hypothetical protein VGD37_28200 [Kofleriaceae bacterium]|jgi:hypothetical protein